MTLLRDVPFSAIYWSLGFLQLPAGLAQGGSLALGITWPRGLFTSL